MNSNTLGVCFTVVCYDCNARGCEEIIGVNNDTAT